MDIQGVKVNAGGEVTDIMIDGNTYGMDKAVKLAKSGLIQGVKIDRRENGEEYISSFDNGMKLADLPGFE
ncbi:DUF3892 domain-containing protein [Desulfotomaculum nigrificans]|uniref:DUF3892 domain-containing protein n=1 Tax=Desulfotomaculum nigrificans TaxID=1565 RepID=UPI0001FAE3AF|nr:DUF3892 domain-containing protein [Desulfotomaculum nigrificans]